MPTFFTFTIEALMPARLAANSEQSLTEGLRFYYALFHAYIPMGRGRPARVEVSTANAAWVLIHEIAREEAAIAFQEAVTMLFQYTGLRRWPSIAGDRFVHSANSDTDDNVPSGCDPLDADWVGAFHAANGRLPTDVDRQDRLFSLMFLGGGSKGDWTAEDWVFYIKHREGLWEGDIGWRAENTAPSYDRFQTHLERLAGHYGRDYDMVTRFTRAVGLVWSGIAYEGPAFQALTRAAIGDHELQLHEGPAGWQPRYVDDSNPAHHWAGAFFAGFMYGTVIGAASNSIRDIAQYVTGQGGTWSDILLGNVAAIQGNRLWHATRDLAGRGRPGEADPYARLLDEMGQDLATG